MLVPLALSKLKVNQFPEVEPPVLVINIPYPGVSRRPSEREVVNRIEKALQSISAWTARNPLRVRAVPPSS